jgi:ATP-dependent Clp protease protease subunit
MSDDAPAVGNRLFVRSTVDDRCLQRDVSKIVRLPKVVYVNKFDEDAAKKFMNDFSDVEDSEQDIIPVCIDSFGGQVYALLSMTDMIKKSKKKVATIILGKAMSCGALLFSQGSEGYRFIGPLATLLIHDVSCWSYGKVEEIKANAGEIERLNQLVYRMMAENTGHPPNYFLDKVHDKGHADWYLDAEETKEHNLANHIRVPQFNIEVKVDLDFG